MTQNRKPGVYAFAICALLVMGAGAVRAHTKNIYIATDNGSVGKTPPVLKVGYAPAAGVYRVAGADDTFRSASETHHYAMFAVLPGEYPKPNRATTLERALAVTTT